MHTERMCLYPVCVCLCVCVGVQSFAPVVGGEGEVVRGPIGRPIFLTHTHVQADWGKGKGGYN